MAINTDNTLALAEIDGHNYIKHRKFCGVLEFDNHRHHTNPNDGLLGFFRLRRNAVEFEYDVSYHLHCTLRLRCGRQVTLEALDQVMSYAGLLEGTPDAKCNDWFIQCSLREAERYCVDGAKPHLK